jgi:hypothetical protein
MKPSRSGLSCVGGGGTEIEQNRVTTPCFSRDSGGWQNRGTRRRRRDQGVGVMVVRRAEDQGVGGGAENKGWRRQCGELGQRVWY